MIYFLFYTPLFIATLYLITAFVYQVGNAFEQSLLYHLPPLILLLIPLLWFLSQRRLIQWRLEDNAWIYVGFVAPLAVIYPWVMAMEPLAGQGYLFFMQWLGKEPNFGPVNFQVFFAIFCILSGSLIPALFALRAVLSIDIRSLLLLFLINVVVFIPVFFKMDLLLWYHALVSQPGVEGSLSLLYGPLLRTTSLFCCGLYLIQRLK